MYVTLDHIVLNVYDVSVAVNFYKNVLCLEVERLEKFEQGNASFPSVRINEDTVIDLFPPRMWKQDEAENGAKNSNINHFCLTFSEHEWNELVLRLKENKIEIERYDDNNWGAKGIGIAIYFRDPDNNLIEARYYRNE